MIKSVLFIISLFSLTIISGQELGFSIIGSQSNPIAKHKFSKAKTLKDIKPGYPSAWISNYISVELISTYEGNTKRAISPDDTLTAEQKKILDSSNIGELIEIKARYQPKNDFKNENEKLIHFAITVVPETQAEFIGGFEMLTKFINDTTVPKLRMIEDGPSEVTEVSFTIDKDGDALNVKIIKSSQNYAIDTLLIEAISAMPLWRPAQNINGEKIQQEIRLSIGSSIGC